MNSCGKSITLPMVLLVILCLILAATVGSIFYLRSKVPEPSAALPTPSPEATFAILPTPRAAEATAASVTPVPAPEATEEPEYQFTQNADRFWTEGALRFSDGYRSPTLSVQVQTVYDSSTFRKRVVYYVADIYVRDVTQIRTESYRQSFERAGSGSVKVMAKRVNALVAISGDYCGSHSNALIIRNGTVYRQNMRSDMDICLLLRDGTMETYRADAITLKEILEKDVWQAWQFGPVLLNGEGEALTSFASSHIATGNPRSCIGYCDPGHYKFVVVDGRQKQSRGLTLNELAALMESMGCRAAFNLDGGASAHFYWHDKIFSKPCNGGRNISDIIYVAKEEYSDAISFHGRGGI